MPVAAIVAIAVGVGAFVLLSGGEAGAEVILEPVTSTGEDPFTESVASEHVADLSGAELAGDPVSGVGGGGSSVEAVAGSVPGLYGGTGEEATCDAEALVAFLEGNPDKAAAFAGVLGVDPGEIGDYVSALTPVVLREDTRVTNHGFSNGEATGFQAVMEAGTAVMVDERGVPRVRCACGNPLAEPAAVSASPEFSGDRWEGFEQDRLVAVSAADEPVDSFELVDVETGETYEKAVGSFGDVRDLIFDFGGVGNLRIGMTEQEAREATGLEVTITDQGLECFFVDIPELNLGGISLDGETIGSLDSSRNGNAPRTPEGITIGSTAQELEAAYPDVERTPAIQNPTIEIARVERDGEIMEFSLDPEKLVTTIATGRSPEVGYLCT